MTHNQCVMACLQGLPVDNDDEDKETRQQRRGVEPPDATHSNTVSSFAASKMTAKVALLTNDRTFSDDLLCASSSKTIDAVAAKILEDKMLARSLQDKEEDDGDGFLVLSSSSNKGGDGGFAPTSSLVNESSGNLCVNVDNDYDDDNGGGFMVASSPVNETVGNDNDDGGGGGFALTSSCRKALLRNSRARTANEEMGGNNDDDEGGGIVMAASPADANGNRGLPSTVPSLEKEGDCGEFVA